MENKNEFEIEYVFKTVGGNVKVKPRDILLALKEQSEKNSDDTQTFDEDLEGWAIIHAKDESGVSRPLFLLRSLPFNQCPPYQLIKNDVDAMGDIILKKVYNLSTLRIKWIRFKNKMHNLFKKILGEI